ncbi:hypothetical protein BDY24DRAFT_9103 [Mrakia frigida]|uniref:uncharacterized protein n=1 Tax=Mrakia frigida TaxID=29902 RepID=UPI003FCBFB7E
MDLVHLSVERLTGCGLARGGFCFRPDLAPRLSAPPSDFETRADFPPSSPSVFFLAAQLDSATRRCQRESSAHPSTTRSHHSISNFSPRSFCRFLLLQSNLLGPVPPSSSHLALLLFFTQLSLLLPPPSTSQETSHLSKSTFHHQSSATILLRPSLGLLDFDSSDTSKLPSLSVPSFHVLHGELATVLPSSLHAELSLPILFHLLLNRPYPPSHLPPFNTFPLGSPVASPFPWNDRVLEVLRLVFVASVEQLSGRCGYAVRRERLEVEEGSGIRRNVVEGREDGLDDLDE